MKDLIEYLIHKQSQRITFLRMGPENILEEDLPPVPIRENESYFQISLCEMYLRDQREYWRNFVPLSLAVSDFFYGGVSQSVPFFIGNKMLRGVEGYLEDSYVDFRNTLITGPVPYTGGNVGLFVGLFRLEVKDLAADLFRLLGSVMGSVANNNLSRYLELARPLGLGLADLLGMKELELRFGLRDEFTPLPGSAQEFRQGYLVYLNAPEGALQPDSLVVEGGRLQKKSGGGKLHPLDEYDHCLIKIEHLTARNDYTNLPFYGRWKEVQKFLLANEAAQAQQAQWKQIELLQQIVDSPDLTVVQQEGLIQVFSLKFAALSGEKGISATATRGTCGVGAADPGTLLQLTATRAKEAGASDNAIKSLMTLSANWQGIDTEEATDDRLAAEIINRQLESLKKIRKGKKASPRELVDAITLSALRLN